MLLNSVLELVGNTPLVKLNKCVDKGSQIYAKIEKNNLTGSIKDRAALHMIEKMIQEGKIKENDTLIEPTSGNTGISLCALANYFSLRCIIVMPKSMSVERRKLIKDYSGELVLVEGGMKECKEKAIALQKEIPNSHIIGQFDNFNNVEAHYLNTAREIISDLKDVDVIVATIGTGGTISGIGKYIKENHYPIEVIGVEPLSSPLITKKIAGIHKIQGIGPNFIPSILNQKVIDKMLLVSDEDAIQTSREIAIKEGLLVGISSGACLSAARSLAKEKCYKNKKIVVIFPDTGERYSWN